MGASTGTLGVCALVEALALFGEIRGAIADPNSMRAVNHLERCGDK
jgi:hypothetical protein